MLFSTGLNLENVSVIKVGQVDNLNQHSRSDGDKQQVQELVVVQTAVLLVSDVEDRSQFFFCEATFDEMVSMNEFFLAYQLIAVHIQCLKTAFALCQTICSLESLKRQLLL